jgi:hypothetical protein
MAPNGPEQAIPMEIGVEFLLQSREMLYELLIERARPSPDAMPQAIEKQILSAG